MKKPGFMLVVIKVCRQLVSIIPVHCALIILSALVNGIFPAAVTASISQTIDSVQSYLTEQTDINKVVTCGCFLAVSYLGKQFFQLISSVSVNAGLFEKGTYHIREMLAEKTSKLKLAVLEDANIHNKLHRATTCVEDETISQFFYHLINMAAHMVSIVFVTGVIIQYHIGFVFIAIVSVAPHVFSRLRQSKNIYEFLAQQSWQDARCRYIWELFFRPGTAKEMRMLGCAEYLLEMYRENKKNLVESMHSLRLKREVQILFGNLSNVLGLCAALTFALYLVGAHKISIGQFAACIAAVSSLQAAAERFLEMISDMPKNISVIRDYYDYLDIPEEDMSIGESIEKIEKLELKDVSFRYPNMEKNTLHEVDLTVEKGESLAIIGENGSGKTTLVKLLLGLYDPSAGKLFVNDRDRDVYGRTFLFDRESTLSQQFIKFKSSLRDNIALADMSQRENDERLLMKIKSCDGDDVYRKCQGLDVILGREFGDIDLSGGEWQKIAMIRAIFKEYDLIVLDEPTSALDAIRETELLKKYISLLKEKTAVVISHRIGMCRLVDKIVVMKDGRIVECGKHEELIRQNGEYSRLFMAQSAWYE